MRKVSGILLTVAFGVALGSSAFAAQASADKGKQIYAAQKCAMCHSVGDAGNKKGPLDEVGTKLKPEDIRQWLISPDTQATKANATRKPAMPSYANKLNKEDLDSLIAYLQTLKKK